MLRCLASMLFLNTLTSVIVRTSMPSCLATYKRRRSPSAAVCGVTLNGAGIACFVLMAIFGGLSWLYRLFTSETSPVLAAAKTVVAALTFSAFCIFFCAMYDFGVSVDRIGVVFGLYGYDGALPEGRTAAEILLVNLLSIGVPHLVCMGLILASLLKALGAGAKGKVSGWIPIWARIFPN